MNEVRDDPRFSDNRERIKNVDQLDAVIQKNVERFSLQQLLDLAQAKNSTFAPINSIAQIFDDSHIQSRENIVPVFDFELNANLKMQNVVGRFSRTPGAVEKAGPVLGEHNRQVLIDELGFDAEQVKSAGIDIVNSK